MDELIIDITEKGQVQSLHMDEFDLGFLGDKKITRASNIVFNELTQMWNIILPKDESPSVSFFECYEEAREFEIKWLQRCRKHGVSPYSLEGQELVRDIAET